MKKTLERQLDAFVGSRQFGLVGHSTDSHEYELYLALEDFDPPTPSPGVADWPLGQKT